MTDVWHCATESDTQALGRRLARELAPDGVLLLTGELGSGKTALVRGLGEGLGVAPAEVQSPTFTLMRSHSGEVADLVHLDLYRLEAEEVFEIGLEEMLASPAVKAVEWAERLPAPLVPEGAVCLHIARDEPEPSPGPSGQEARIIRRLPVSSVV